MSWYTHFYVWDGIYAVAAILVLGWALRTASGGWLAKVAAILALIVIAIWQPFTVNGLLGHPIDSSPELLPNDFILLALDEQGRQVYLFLRDDENAPPKSFAVVFPNNAKGNKEREAFREAARMLREQHGVRMRRNGGNKKGAGFGAGGRQGNGGAGGDQNGDKDSGDQTTQDNLDPNDTGMFHVDRRFVMPPK